jgi:hypothetical protein
MAAGLVLVVTAALDLLGRLPSPEPALAGWGAAVVPVFVPLALRPGLALAAISLGADHGTLVVAVGVAVAAAVAVGASAARATADPAGESAVGGRVWRWVVGFTAVVLAVVAVALVVDGIYTV